jgi:hypothetical protein
MLRALRLTVIVIALVAAAVAAVPAGADQPVPAHEGLVPDIARDDTPYVASGKVFDIEVFGNRAVVVGTFTRVRNVGGDDIDQPYIFAYDLDSGRLDMSFRPRFDRPINEVETSPDGRHLYVAGKFNNVNGITRRKVVKLDLSGEVVTAFRANASAQVSAIDVGDGHVYLGGTFKRVGGQPFGALAAVDPMTGDVDPEFDLPVTEGLGPGGLLKVHTVHLTRDESTLLVVHTGRLVDGEERTGIALIDTATKQLLPWRTDLYRDHLVNVGGTLRILGGDIAPDDSYFVTFSGSGGDRPPINDTAVAFPLEGAAGVDPLWVSRHFDSVYSVAISEVAVYVGGHFRWQEAPGSTDPWPGDTFTGYGANNGQGAAVLGDEVVRRDQLGALDPATGKALDWNPGSNARVGVQALTVHERGVFLGHDGRVAGFEPVGRHAFFDLESVPDPTTADTFITDPFSGLAVPADVPFVFGGTAVADGGVTRVQVEIKNRTTKEFLQDDGSIERGWNGMDTDLADPGAAETVWTFEGTLPPGEWQIKARSWSGNGDRDPSKARTNFVVDALDDLPPSGRFITPGSGPLSTNTFSIAGDASDDRSVVAVRLVFREDATENYLQDDGSVTSAYNAFQAELETPGEPFTTWSFEVTLPEGAWRATATAIDDIGQTDSSFSRRSWDVFPTNEVPTVAITAPTDGTEFPHQTQLTIEGMASDDGAVDLIEVRVRNDLTRYGMQANGLYGPNAGYYRVTPVPQGGTTVTWTVTTPPLPPGVYTVQARAYDDLGVRTPSADYARVSVAAVVPGDEPPDTRLDGPAYTQDIDTLDITVGGTASDDRGVEQVMVQIYNWSLFRWVAADGSFVSGRTWIPASVATPGAIATTWSLPLSLAGPGRFTMTAVAVDDASQWDPDSAAATAEWLIFPGDADPTIELSAPTTGEVVTTFIPVGGRAFDDTGVDAVEVQIIDDSGQFLTAGGSWSKDPVWIDAFVTNPRGLSTNWSYASPDLPPGTYTILARSRDINRQLLQVPAAATGVVVPAR